MTTTNACGNILRGTNGTGAYVGATSPTLTTPTLNSPNFVIAGTSYTPSLSSSVGSFTSVTYSTQTGEYIKIGNIVYYTFFVTVSAVSMGTASGILYVSLPVAGTAIPSMYMPCAVLTVATLYTGPMYLQPIIGASSIAQFVNISDTNTAVILPPSNVQTNATFRASGFYFTA